MQSSGAFVPSSSISSLVPPTKNLTLCRVTSWTLIISQHSWPIMNVVFAYQVSDICTTGYCQCVGEDPATDTVSDVGQGNSSLIGVTGSVC